MVIKHKEDINSYLQVTNEVRAEQRPTRQLFSCVSLILSLFTASPPRPHPHTHYRPQPPPLLLVTERHEAMDVQCPRRHQTLPSPPPHSCLATGLSCSEPSEHEEKLLSGQGRKNTALLRFPPLGGGGSKRV